MGFLAKSRQLLVRLVTIAKRRSGIGEKRAHSFPLPSSLSPFRSAGSTVWWGFDVPFFPFSRPSDWDPIEKKDDNKKKTLVQWIGAGDALFLLLPRSALAEVLDKPTPVSPAKKHRTCPGGPAAFLRIPASFLVPPWEDARKGMDVGTRPLLFLGSCSCHSLHAFRERGKSTVPSGIPSFR